MELSWIEMFACSASLMTILYLLFFTLRAIYAYHNLGSNISRIIAGSIVAGIGTGAFLGFLFWCVLPTYYYIEATNKDGYYTRYVLNNKFTSEYGRTFVINQTNEIVYLAAMTYGNSELGENEDAIIPIEFGSIVESPHEINGWFKPFPESVSTKSSGKTEWYILTETMLITEYKKIGIDLTK